MRKIVLLLIIFCAIAASAQEISVSSFRMLESDLTANTTGTMERDQNGEVAALIKVVTSEQGFVFDGGMVGIVKARQEVGEVWVYVPHGIKRITMKHPQLGVLRDYYFPIPIEKARTYEMVLSTGRVETYVTHRVNKQFVVFNVQPAHAIVELGDEMLSVDSEGYAEKGVPFGTYSYRVSCDNYQTEAGQVTVTKDHRVEVNVKLRPNFGWIRFDGAEELHGAYIYIDNERVGQLPMTAMGGKGGVHQVRIMKPLYKTFTQQVTVVDNDTVSLHVDMTPNFAKVTVVSADDQGEIWIDGQQRGVGRWTGSLEIGEYMVEVRRESHRAVSDVIRIDDHSEKTIRLGSPTPIYTTLEVSSRPSNAMVYLDGNKLGSTPLITDEVLIGTHQLTFKRAGYRTEERTVQLKANEENVVSVAMVQDGSVPEEDDEPQASTSSKEPKSPKVPKAPKAPKVKKPSEWRGIIGIEAGTSAYGLNGGAELGIAHKRLSLTMGARAYMLGVYSTYNSYLDYIMSTANTTTQSIVLARFSAKVGYTLPIGKHLKITPQAGALFGPSVCVGGDYLSGKVVSGYQYPQSTIEREGYKVLDERLDYNVMNRNIMQFAALQYGLVVGARLELTTANSRWGVHATPEYVIGEGLIINGGLVVRF